jgi:hypothetical protein
MKSEPAFFFFFLLSELDEEMGGRGVWGEKSEQKWMPVEFKCFIFPSLHFHMILDSAVHF